MRITSPALFVAGVWSGGKLLEIKYPCNQNYRGVDLNKSYELRKLITRD
jgi:hypothetical protein